MTWWNKYTGKVFKDKGRGPDVFDCWGLVWFIFKNEHPRKIVLPDYLECYESTDDVEILSKVISEKKEKSWRPITKPQMFDVILLRERGVPMHVGIVTKPGSMLHCGEGYNTVHEKYDSMRWGNKILGFYRYE